MLKVKISNEEKPAFVTAGAMLYYHEMTGREVTDIKTTVDLIRYCYCCYKACEEREGGKAELTLNQFANRLDMPAFNDWCKALAAEAAAVEEGNEANP